MLNLTTPISVPNIQKMHVDSVLLDVNLLQAIVFVSVQGTGGVQYGSPIPIVIKDGDAQGIRATVSPLGYGDRVEVFAVTVGVSTSFTDIVTAYTGGIVARNKAVESVLMAAGLLPAGSVA